MIVISLKWGDDAENKFIYCKIKGILRPKSDMLKFLEELNKLLAKMT